MQFISNIDYYLAIGILALFSYTLPLFQFSMQMNLAFATLIQGLYDMVNWIAIYLFFLSGFAFVGNILFG